MMGEGGNFRKVIEIKHVEKIMPYLVLVSEKPESKRLPILTQHKL